VVSKCIVENEKLKDDGTFCESSDAKKKSPLDHLIV
jgi:hypothetical protein